MYNYVLTSYVYLLFLQRSYPGSADEADNITDEELEGKNVTLTAVCATVNSLLWTLTTRKTFSCLVYTLAFYCSIIVY